MESFLISVIAFVALALSLGVWRHVTKKTTKNQAAQVDRQIVQAAEVAQRRHKQRFGRASTDLNNSLNGALPREAQPSKS